MLAIAEYQEENRILHKHFPQVSPAQVLESCHIQDTVPLFLRDMKKLVVGDPYALMYHDDCYVSYNTYFNNWKSQKTLKTINAIVINLVDITPEALEQVILQGIKKWAFRPTYLHNAGASVQVIYAFTDAIPAYKQNVKEIEKVIKQIRGWYRLLGKAYGFRANADLTKDYRLPGSQTELGYTTTCFIVDDAIELDRLQHRFKLSLFIAPKRVEEETRTIPTPERVNYKEIYAARAEMVKAKANMIAAGENVSELPNAHPSFYNWYRTQIFACMPTGKSRELVMCCMVAVGWKSRISRAEVEADVRALAVAYNKQLPKGKKAITESTIRYALRFYGHHRSTKMTAKRLEEWSGILFPRLHRSKNSQVDHLQNTRKIAEANKLERGKNAILSAWQKGINSLDRLVEDTGLSKPTVIKYRKLLISEGITPP